MLSVLPGLYLYNVTFLGPPTRTLPHASPQKLTCLISHIQNHKSNHLQEIYSHPQLINGKTVALWPREVMPHAGWRQSQAWRPDPLVSRPQLFPLPSAALEERLSHWTRTVTHNSSVYSCSKVIFAFTRDL